MTEAARVEEFRRGGPVLRHDRRARMHHGGLALTVIVLVVTGFVLRVEALAFLAPMLGGARVMGIVHRAAGAILAIGFLHHLGSVVLPALLRALRSRRIAESLPLLPAREDLSDLRHTGRYWLGRERLDHPGRRYSYRFKLHYLAILWGVPVMGLTGLVLAAPVEAARAIAGGLAALGFPATTASVIRVSEIVHGEEALLVVGVSILWHGYRTCFPLRRDMWTGKLSLEELERDHPRWYDELRRASRSADDESGSAS